MKKPCHLPKTRAYSQRLQEELLLENSIYLGTSLKQCEINYDKHFIVQGGRFHQIFLIKSDCFLFRLFISSIFSHVLAIFFQLADIYTHKTCLNLCPILSILEYEDLPILNMT